MTEKDRSEPVAIVLRDIETGNNVSIEVVREFQRIATNMGLDLRLGHLLPMGGKPYITHEGTKALMLKDDGPGIKNLSYSWITDDFDNQRFVCKATITSRDGAMTVEGEGDAFGVPVAKLQELITAGKEDYKKDTGPNKRRGTNWFIKERVREYSIKNVSSQIAINLASRRMAQTRAYNRAARMMLKISLPTVEEIPLEEEAIEGAAREIASIEQVAKILEFHKSEKPGLKKLFEQYLEYGKPENWDRATADEFIKRAIEVAEMEVQRAKKEPAKDEKGSLAEKDWRQ